MKALPIAALLIAMLLFVSPVAADAHVDPPLPDPVDDITSDLESLPDLYGLGALVALLVVLARRLALPDGWGGYAALAVGVVVYVITQILPDAQARQIFDVAEHVAKTALLIIGSQVTHASLKHAGLDKFWKGK